MGKSSGELSLLNGKPVTATVTAKSDVTVWVFDKPAFDALLREPTLDKRVRFEKFLGKVCRPCLTGVSKGRVIDLTSFRHPHTQHAMRMPEEFVHAWL